jgi:subtilisin-like proprotein convertase family protein
MFIAGAWCARCPAATTYSATGNQTNLRIPTSGTGGSNTSADFTFSTISVTGIPADQTVGDIDVLLALTHSFDFDLVMTLIAPDGRRILLASHRGGTGDNYSNTTFDDQAALSIADGSAPFAGSFRPEQTLAQLAGMNANGLWTLEINDTEATDIGNLSGWSLTITNSAVPEPAGVSLVIGMLGVLGLRRPCRGLVNITAPRRA